MEKNMSPPTDAAPPPHVQMLHIMMGHWIAQAAATVARFEIPDHLAAGPRTVAELAGLTGANPDALNRLLRAAVSVGILREVEPAVYANSPLGETLRKDAPVGLRDLVVAELAPGHWLPWGHLYDAVKGGGSQARAALGCDTWEYYARTPEEGACFARGMGNVSAIAAAEVLPAYDFSRFEHIVDVGGSEGVMLAGALRAAPGARGVLFDLPEVIDRGGQAIAQHGLGGRLQAVGGDFRAEVPPGGDLYILKAILHDWDDDGSLTILRNVRQAARPGAKIVVIEMVLPERVSPSPVHLMDLNMLVMLGGRERAEPEFASLFDRAGLRFERAIPTRGLFSLLEATRV
jgi:hypothetical protein